MKHSDISLFLTLALFSYPTFCSDFLTSEEKELLSDINSKYKSEDKLKLQNRNLTSLMILKERAASLELLINENEKSFSLSTKDLTTNLSKGHVESIDMLYSSIKELSTELAKSRVERDEVNSQLSDTSLSIKAINNELNVLHLKRSHSLQELRKTIYLRLQREYAIAKDISGVVSVKCRTNVSLESCVSSTKTKQHVIDDLLDQNEIESQDAKVVEFNIDNATMNMNGITAIRASMKIQSSISNNIRKSIDKTLGLSAINIKLTSNVPSRFYIDGVYVGEGESLSTTISIGNHAIYSSYSGQYQSAIVSTNNGSDKFHFPFKEGRGRKTDKTENSVKVGTADQEESMGKSVNIGQAGQEEKVKKLVNASKDGQKVKADIVGKEVNKKIYSPMPDINDGVSNLRKASKGDIRQLFIHKSDSMAIFIPTHSHKSNDTYYSDGNLLGRYTFDDASKICHSMGKRSLIATGQIYAELLNKGVVMNTVGMKSSFWLAPGKVITKIEKDLYIKNVEPTAKYSVLCMRFTGSS